MNTVVTVLLVVFGVLAYGGLGYLGIRIQANFNKEVKEDLWDRLERLENNSDRKTVSLQCLAFKEEYNYKTSWHFKNRVLNWIVLGIAVLIWPISATVCICNEYYVYRKILKKIEVART